jgi:hypothetical protein
MNGNAPFAFAVLAVRVVAATLRARVDEELRFFSWCVTTPKLAQPRVMAPFAVLFEAAVLGPAGHQHSGNQFPESSDDRRLNFSTASATSFTMFSGSAS